MVTSIEAKLILGIVLKYIIGERVFSAVVITYNIR